MTPNDISPADRAEGITPADDYLDHLPRALYIGGAGYLSLDMAGQVISMPAVAGAILPVRPARILPDTTATDIIALY